MKPTIAFVISSLNSSQNLFKNCISFLKNKHIPILIIEFKQVQYASNWFILVKKYGRGKSLHLHFVLTNYTICANVACVIGRILVVFEQIAPKCAQILLLFYTNARYWIKSKL
jgi:hypothetical protein